MLFYFVLFYLGDCLKLKLIKLIFTIVNDTVIDGVLKVLLCNNDTGVIDGILKVLLCNNDNLHS